MCRESFVEIRSVVMIALLAICRKVIIPDQKETDASQTFALAAALAALASDPGITLGLELGNGAVVCHPCQRPG
jgi:hypothetical protein